MNQSTHPRFIGGGRRILVGVWFWPVFLLDQMVGCARIYRPITLAPAPIHGPTSEVQATVQLQPWGDNSRYMGRAHREGVQMLALTVTNGTGHPVRVTLDPEPSQGHWLSPDQAHALIKQSRMGFALYPIGSLVVFPPGQTGAWSVLANTISAISFGATLTIAISNAAVANNSNRKLEAFFQQNAWTDGEVPGAESRQGLLWFRPSQPLRAQALIRLQIADARGSHLLEVPVPEQPAQ